MRGQSFTSANQAMRRLFGLYANVRPARNFKLPWVGAVPPSPAPPRPPTAPRPQAQRFDDVDVDMLIVRENTEDLYCGKPEVWVDEDTCEATKRITRSASTRIGVLPRAAGRPTTLTPLSQRATPLSRPRRVPRPAGTAARPL